MFKTEINEMTKGNIPEHSIFISCDRPHNEKGTVPNLWVEEIDNEFKKLL